MRKDHAAQIIFEFIRMGTSIRASAMHPDTLTEVVMIVPTNTPEAYIKSLLIRKLNERIENNAD